ncbi:MAG: hypothetical protein ACOYNC_00970 [Bacteroidales bacterium]
MEIGPLQAQNEDIFLSNILKKLKTDLGLDNEALGFNKEELGPYEEELGLNKNENIAFLVKYVCDDKGNAYYCHLKSDIFDELNTANKTINIKHKDDIKKILIDAKNGSQDIFNIISHLYKLEILDNEPSDKHPQPLNEFLVSIPQFPADFSQGYLGKFYPFCQISENCYKSKDKDNYQICKKSKAFNIDTLKECGLWLNSEDYSDEKREFIKQAKSSIVGVDELKYKIISEIEEKLFPVKSNKISIAIPIILRAHCNCLIFIQASKIDENSLKNVIWKYISQIGKFYDNEFYFSFFTQLEHEGNFAKILAKPEILSRIFYLRTNGINPLEIKVIPNDNCGETVKIEIVNHNVAISLYGYNLFFEANLLQDDGKEDEFTAFFQHFIDSLEQVKIVKKAFFKKNLKTAIISILIDSYAHNISAHSLAALKWWFELRHRMLDKRFFIKDGGINISGLVPVEISIDDKQRIEATSAKYYEALGLTDSSYNKDYYSLFDFLQFQSKEFQSKLFSFSANDKDNLGIVKNGKQDISFNPRFPVPLDYAIFPFFRFLRDKGAFWSGVTRDMAFGGESKTWYKILWEDFANNPLYLGTIAKSEGIHIININLAVKTGDDENDWFTGNFITIDLSIINAEERLAQNSRLRIEYEKADYDLVDSSKFFSKEEIEKLKDKERKDINDAQFLNKLDAFLEKHYFGNAQTTGITGADVCSNGDDNKRCDNAKNYVEYGKYSPYGFIRLGKCFEHFRTTLDNENEFKAFLPGGIVGEHALFTIFENTIRNIKHYKDDTLKTIQKDGINFWISIEKVFLEDGSNEKEQLFKVGTWLGHETAIFKKVTETSSSTNKMDYLLETISAKSIQPILDENTGAPKMGGNSQDKACAAMLFNNEFISVERKEHIRDLNYYPWIKFATCKETSQFKKPDCFNKNYYTGTNAKKEDAIEKYKGIATYEKGYLIKYFHLWRGADYFEVGNENQLHDENISRFTFVIIKGNDEGGVIYKRLRKEGVVRILNNQQTGSYTGIDNLYQVWLNKWFEIKKSEGKNFKFYRNTDSILSYLSLEYEKIIYEPFIPFSNKSIPKVNQRVKFSHGGPDESDSCNVRSHGVFWSKPFKNAKDKDVRELATKIDVLSQHMYELAETLATRIMIFDNRIFERFKQLSESKRKMFSSNLNLIVCEEFLEKRIKDDASNSDNKDERQEKLSLSTMISNKQKDFSENSFPHLLIIHLSFIEALLRKDGSKYSTDTISEFVSEELKDLIGLDNFVFIITTGRGRDSWWNELEKRSNQDHIMKIMFKPVESLLNAVESGLSYNDNYDVKYNLNKLIFGS